ncbi:MAG: class I SAM-dependent rRNA methyltransferase [Bacteroidota bacterium]
MSAYKNLKLKGGKEKSLLRQHPWVFSGALVEDIRQTPEASIVKVVDSKGNYIATGYVQHGSIAIRILTYTDIAIDQNYWNATIQNSWNMRKKLGFTDNPTTNCFRLMHGEGDHVSGLIIDYYAGTCVIQSHTSGIYAFRNEITMALQNVLGQQLKAVFDKSAETLHGSVPDAANGFLFGQQEETTVLENGYSFKVDFTTGQKTGFFLDQRDNRSLLGHYAKGKTVLNTFAYTGGFSVYAMMQDALKVDSIDVSKNAIELLKENMQMNRAEHNGEALAMDTFQYFKTLENPYDIVILDPPAFAKNMSAKHNALMGYKRLNMEGLKHVAKGGLLFTFSCSQVVDSFTFNQTILSAAIESNRKVKIIHRLTQPADHPVNIFHPEGEYLKGLVLFVE